MEEDWFLYSVTLFTFAVIFLFCYIHHTFTYFEKNKIVSKSPTPSFPFGNVYDVLSRELPMFLQLHKLYQRFNRRKVQFGGFYIFQQPTIICVDPDLCETVLSHANFTRDTNANIAADCTAKVVTYLLQNFTVEDCLKSAKSDVNISRIVDDMLSKNGVLLETATVWKNFKQFLTINHPRLFNFSRVSFYKAKSRGNLALVKYLKENGLDENEAVEVAANCLYQLEKSASAIILALYELSLSDEIQEDLRGEINRFRKERSVTKLEDLEELKYLDTVVSETLRKYPVDPFTYRISRQKIVIPDGKTIPEGLNVFIPTYAIHHDVLNYTNPELFDPDRFSEENEQFINPSKYLPFGYPRNKERFESQLVRSAIKLILIDIVPNFKLDSSRKTKRSFPQYAETVTGLVLKEDLWLKIERLL